ncbi:hypothetical protein BTR40_06800 [Vibrio parahaemolyticus]|uniref:hypothetical protein n=1 Tax=Vibrio parahaemolyticus TaxID=670 RepID=UPI000A3BE668|nr:hypothetical protein [Vibrio parahaemolyticus]OUJ36712.1 hypothetical protein BTR40_06800 [Vibrio parahaemolyticus]
MRLLTLSAAVVVALTGCASTSKQETRQLSLAPINEGMLTVSGIGSLILDRTGDNAIAAAYDCTGNKNTKLNSSGLLGLAVRGVAKVAESMSSDYLPAELTARVTDTGIEATFLNVPNGCALSTGKVSMVLNQNISAIYAEYPQVAEELLNREKQKELKLAEAKQKREEKEAEKLRQVREAEAKRLAAVEKPLKEEAYAKSPKGQMDRYALGSAELTVCAENLLITSTQARNGKKNLASDMKKRLASSYDQAYFTEQYKQHYNSVSNLVALNGYTTEMHRACRVAASIANQS